MDRDRQRAAPALAALGRDVRPDTLDGAQRHAIRMLSVSVALLGHILREQGKPDCVEVYQEAVQLAECAGDHPGAAVLAFNLGHAYKDLPALRDLAQAERWYRRSLELRDERDRLGQSKIIDQIGLVVLERFREARAAGASNEQLLEYANEAVRAFQQSIDLAPPNAVDKLGLSHQHLGNIYIETGHLDRALPHWREAIRYFEAGRNLYLAANTRFNVAVALAESGRLADAREYAHAALRNYQTYGDRAAEEIQKTQGLIAAIEGAMGKSKT